MPKKLSFKSSALGGGV